MPSPPPALSAHAAGRCATSRCFWRYVRPYGGPPGGRSGRIARGSGLLSDHRQGLKQVIDAGFAQRDARGARPGADASAGGRRGDGERDVHALLFRVVAGRARGRRSTQRGVFAHLLTLSPAYFEQQRTGEVVSRLTADSALLEQVVGTSVSLAARNLVMGAGSLIMLALTSLKLTLLVLLMVPLVIAPIALFGRRVRRLSRASQDRVADLGAYLDEALHEIRTLQAYGHEKADRALFGARVARAFDTARRRIRQRAALIAAVILLVFGGVGAILWVGGHDVPERAPQCRRTVCLRVLLDSGRGRGRRHQRGCGRPAARRRARPSACSRSCVQCRPWRCRRGRCRCLRRPEGRLNSTTCVSLSGATRPACAGRAFSLRVVPGEKLAVVGPSGRASPRCSSFCYASTIRAAGRSGWTAWTCAGADPAQVRRRNRPGGAGTGNLRGQRARECALWPHRCGRCAGAPGLRRGIRHRVRRTAAARLRHRAGGSAECACPAASGSDWRSRARGPVRTARSCCWMRRQVHWIRESERIVQAALERLMRDRTTIIHRAPAWPTGEKRPIASR